MIFRIIIFIFYSDNNPPRSVLEEYAETIIRVFPILRDDMTNDGYVSINI